MTTDTLTIPASRVFKIKPKIEKLAKKAKKYGNAPISVEVGDAYVTEYTNPFTGLKAKIDVCDVIVTGEAPKVAGGWVLQGRVELGEENLLFSMGDDLDPKYRSWGNVCEHCGKHRSRKDIYVFRNPEGEELVVGRSCLKDFIGAENPLLVVHATAFWQGIKAEEDDLFTDFFGEPLYKTRSILEVAAADIRDRGFVSKRRQETHGDYPTSEVVKEWFAKGGSVEGLEISDEDKETAQKTLDYFATLEPQGDEYNDNLRILLRTDAVESVKVGIVSSAVAAYQRTVAMEIEAENSADSVFVGAVNERLRGLELTVEKVINCGFGSFGETILYNFRDDTGNVFVWFTSPKELSQGDKVTVDATVKEHKEYNGVNQTALTRAKIK